MDADMELVLDTLYDRKQSDRQSCFAVNQSGLILLKSPPSIVSVIEQVVRDVVDPVLSRGAADARGFPGLDYVLGAYLVLGVMSNPDRVVRFLSALSAPLLVEAIQNIPVFLAPPGRGYNSGVSPGRHLKELLENLSKAECDDVRAAADRVMARMNDNEHV